jgi:uncharacterized membrane protein YfcA
VTPVEPAGFALAVGVAAVFVGSVLQGAVGFGFALVAAPILLLIDPHLVPGPIIFASLFLTGLSAWRDRRAIDFSGLRWGVTGRVPGTLLGAALLAFLPPERMAAPFGAIVLLAVAISAAGARVEPTPRALVGAGLLSGVMGTVSSIGGPPFALLYQHAAGDRLRGTLGGYFVIGTAMSLIVIAAVGRFGIAELRWGVALVPGTLLGFAVSSRLTPWLDRGYTRPAVLAVAAVAGVAGVVRQLW